MALLKLEHMTFTYPGTDQPALKDVSLAVDPSDFVVVCGPSGCGKTTLVRSLKREIAPHGALDGRLSYQGHDMLSESHDLCASAIGFVMQDPDAQIVTDTVWHELAFGLENMGLPTSVIRRRVAETAHFFGINTWFERSVFSLSGGQKQVLNLAGVMAMQPDILILDEPVAQLDPIAAKEFISVLKRIHLELGTTVVMTEHMLEDVFPLADTVVYMEQGRISFIGSPEAFVRSAVTSRSHPYEKAFPAAVKIARDLGEVSHIPITVNQGRVWLQNYQKNKLSDQKRSAGRQEQVLSSHQKMRADAPDKASDGLEKQYAQTNKEKHLSADRQADTSSVTMRQKQSTSDVQLPSKPKPPGLKLLKADSIWFRYQPDLPFVLQNFSCDIIAGEILAIVGGNGSGKSTALHIMSGLARPQRGKMVRSNLRLDSSNPPPDQPGRTQPEGTAGSGKKRIWRRLLRKGKQADSRPSESVFSAMLPQNPKALFIEDTVYDDLSDSLSHMPPDAASEQIQAIASDLRIQHLLHKHPYDLSGGEQQKAALAKLLLLQPQVMLLDEPTKGLDIYAKHDLAAILKRQSQQGKAIVIVTHDIEFAAAYTDRCAMIFNGEITCIDQAKAFFAGNTFYTTAANRMSRGILENAVTCEDVVSQCISQKT